MAARGYEFYVSRAESIFHEWAKRTIKKNFQHERIKFVSPRGYVISSIL